MMITMRSNTSIAVIALTILLLFTDAVASFSLPFLASTAVGSSSGKTSAQDELLPIPTKDVVSSVAVVGATGRTGQYTVQELLKRDVSKVIAVVRDVDKASDIFGKGDDLPSNLEIVKCNLLKEEEVEAICEQVDAAIWCATGFSSNQETSLGDKVKSLFGIATNRTIDSVGLPAFAEFLSNKAIKNVNGQGTENLSLPKFVMCSSAAVTRPTWDETKQQEFSGAADIPIVRLNPFGVLNVKRESEESLRQSDVEYCIVRPSGLNDEWPAGSRPVFTQGDVAVGRIHRKDVAQVLVDVLSTPEATGKTFEVTGLSGYPQATTIRPTLERLLTDKEGLPSKEYVTATYNAMQQLLPGEKQNAAALAMGQTYEQLDENKVGRLGERGKEDLSKIDA